jgi:hypothetical protein
LRPRGETGGFQGIEALDTFVNLEELMKGFEFKVLHTIIIYNLRKYSLRKLTEQAIRRGKGRRQIGQSLLFMIGHGLYYLTRTPFRLVELLADIIGYL